MGRGEGDVGGAVVALTTKLVTIYDCTRATFSTCHLDRGSCSKATEAVTVKGTFATLNKSLKSVKVGPTNDTITKCSRVAMAPNIAFTTTASRKVVPFRNDARACFRGGVGDDIAGFYLPGIKMDIGFGAGEASKFGGFAVNFIVGRATSCSRGICTGNAGSGASFVKTLTCGARVSRMNLANSCLSSRGTFSCCRS